EPAGSDSLQPIYKKVQASYKEKGHGKFHNSIACHAEEHHAPVAGRLDQVQDNIPLDDLLCRIHFKAERESAVAQKRHKHIAPHQVPGHAAHRFLVMKNALPDVIKYSSLNEICQHPGEKIAA